MTVDLIQGFEQDYYEDKCTLLEIQGLAHNRAKAKWPTKLDVQRVHHQVETAQEDDEKQHPSPGTGPFSSV